MNLCVTEINSFGHMVMNPWLTFQPGFRGNDIMHDYESVYS